MPDATSAAPPDAVPDAVPLYRRVKRAILARIRAGDWPAGHKVPSENALVRSTGASRMTVNRALRELADEGHIRRVRGAGSFVAEAKAESDLMVLRSIAEEIAARGHAHAADLHTLDTRRLAPAEAAELGLAPGAAAYRSVLVHRENGLAVQLEDRLVNPALAPGYLTADFAAETPNAYLTRCAPADHVEHVVEAGTADARIAALLEIAPGDPCLIAIRRTWVGTAVASLVRLTHPADRYRLTAGAPPEGAGLRPL